MKPGDYVSDLSPKAFRRAYVKALFLENKKWTTAIEKYQIIVQGSFKNSRDRAKDTAEKERLQDQVSAETNEGRKAFYRAWRDAECCADDCELYCDRCQNKEIKFKSVPAHRLDTDVRRFITKYGRYQTASELEAELKIMRKSNARKARQEHAGILSGVRDGKSDNEFVWIPGQERGRLSGQPEEVASNQAERVEAMLSHPFGEEVAARSPDQSNL